MGLRLFVSAGPEAGRRQSFPGSIVNIGRGPKNDLVLRDGLVSLQHGQIITRNDGYLYRDLQSRHGTLVRFDQVTVNLHDRAKQQEIALVNGVHLVLGETVIRVDWPEETAQRPVAPTPGTAPTVPATPAAVARSEPGGEPPPIPDSGSDHVLAVSHASLEAVAQRLSSQDPRLLSIFKLSRNLSGTTILEQVLDLLAEATFEAFPGATFFAITHQQGNQPDSAIEILTARERHSEQVAEGTPTGPPMLTRSLLNQVAEKREAVLFVRDQAGANLSESIVNARITACLAAPLVGQRELLGVMQADTRAHGSLFGPDDLDLFSVMASYAAFALERVRLNRSIVEMFEGIVKASVTAIDARDPSTAGHSERVAALTVELAKAVNGETEGPLASLCFSDAQIQELRYAALLHDFGKIGVSEDVLTKADRWYPAQRHAVVERFQAIKTSLVMAAQKELLNGLLLEKRAPREPELYELERRMAQACAEADDELAFLLAQLREAHITPQAAQRIREITAKTYSDAAGHAHSYLLADECDHLLAPHGTLTHSEWEEMQSHARISRQYLSLIPWSEELGSIPAVAGWHHEKLDGSGYPDGIRGEQIPPSVRVLTICDIFDALTAADRPYRRAVSVTKAREILSDEAERGLLDRQLVELFCRVVVPAE